MVGATTEWVAALGSVPDATQIAAPQARWAAAHYVRTAVALATFAALVAGDGWGGPFSRTRA